MLKLLTYDLMIPTEESNKVKFGSGLGLDFSNSARVGEALWAKL